MAGSELNEKEGVPNSEGATLPLPRISARGAPPLAPESAQAASLRSRNYNSKPDHGSRQRNYTRESTRTNRAKLTILNPQARFLV